MAAHTRYLREQVIPTLTEGAATAGRADGGPRIVVVPRCVTAPDQPAITVAREAVRREMAFLYSTPAYRPTLTLLGMDGIGHELTELVQQQQWTRLPAVLPDSVLAQLISQGTYAELPTVLDRWYGGLCDGLNVTLPPGDAADTAFAAMLTRLRDIDSRSLGSSTGEGSESA